MNVSAPFSLVWFAFRDDEELLKESLKAARRTFGDDVTLHVCDDGFAACSRAFREACRADGVDYVQTFFPRGGNLLGPDNLKGQTREMARIVRATGAKVLIKIDCDTLLLRRDWLDDFLADDTASMAGSYKGLHNYPMGHCYAVKADRCAALAEDCETYPAWANCFEDYEIGTRLHRLAQSDMGYAQRWRSGIEDGFWLCSPEQVDDRAKSARVVSCGFNLGGVPPQHRAKFKAAQVKVMQRINAELTPKASPEAVPAAKAPEA